MAATLRDNIDRIDYYVAHTKFARQGGKQALGVTNLQLME
jgi:hypothetical protein